MRKALLITGALILLDAATKILAQKFFGATINPQIAFSIPVSNIMMMVITPLLLIFFHWFSRKYFYKNDLSVWVWSLIMAGGIGNLWNRFIFGGVIDFIDLGFWPSFNLADSYLTISAFLLIFFYGKIVKDERKSHESDIPDARL